MTKFFLIAAALLLVASAGLGFLNKNKMADKQAAIVKSQSETAAAQADAGKAKTAQKKAEKDTADAVSKSNELQQQLTTASSQVTTLNGKIDEVSKQVEAKQNEINTLTTRLVAYTNASPPPAPPGAAEELEKAKHQLAELQVIKDGLQTQLASAQSQTASLQKRITDRETSASMMGLHGRVLAVDRNWNFVVLDLGNRNGVNANATMVIQRGSSMVGRVKITTVEPSQSIADIVPNSVPAGVTVQPGDTVVFPGT